MFGSSPDEGKENAPPERGKSTAPSEMGQLVGFGLSANGIVSGKRPCAHTGCTHVHPGSMKSAQASSGAPAGWPTTGTILTMDDDSRQGNAAKPQPESVTVTLAQPEGLGRSTVRLLLIAAAFLPRKPAVLRAGPICGPESTSMRLPPAPPLLGRLRLRDRVQERLLLTLDGRDRGARPPTSHGVRPGQHHAPR